jgi:hypothetical protein
MIYTMLVFLGVKWLGMALHSPPPPSIQVKEKVMKAQKICGKLNKLK